MTTVASVKRTSEAVSVAASTASTLGFDILATALAIWMVSGLYLDGWAHTHGKVDQSVVTPWHGVLYSGFLALAGLYAITYLRNRSTGRPARHAMPAGYGLSLVGTLLFLAGGVGDTTWHILLGIEIGVDALYSPTHLVLAVGGILMITGPVRGAWQRAADASSWRTQWPVVVALTGMFCVFTFFLQVMHPLSQRAATGTAPADPRLFFSLQSMGIAGVVITSMLLVGLILVAVRNQQMPFGSFAFAFGVNAWAMSFLSIGFPVGLIPAAAAAGLVADVLLKRFDRLVPAAGPITSPIVGFVVPAVYFLLYFLVLQAGPGIWWTVHLWMGAPVIAGIAGWMVAYAMSSTGPLPSESTV
ncbi:MAG TPA: hypothetical protein VHJ78_07105 [Actinomycetota bacterium]|nr:hypothetical protein [Actinomycetota bacterium]